MKLHYLISLLLLSSLIACKAQKWTLDEVVVYDAFDEMAHIFESKSDTTYLINFWATWCGPCVKELPYIESVNKKYRKGKFKTILVSLDMKKKLESKLVPFLNENKIESEVVVLLDGKANDWIDRVDESWSGAIPITIVYKNETREFHEVEFHSDSEIETIIERIINN